MIVKNVFKKRSCQRIGFLIRVEILHIFLFEFEQAEAISLNEMASSSH